MFKWLNICFRPRVNFLQIHLRTGNNPSIACKCVQNHWVVSGSSKVPGGIFPCITDYSSQTFEIMLILLANTNDTFLMHREARCKRRRTPWIRIFSRNARPFPDSHLAVLLARDGIGHTSVDNRTRCARTTSLPFLDCQETWNIDIEPIVKRFNGWWAI